MIEQLLMKSSRPKHNEFHRKLHRSNGTDHLRFNTVAVRLEGLFPFANQVSFCRNTRSCMGAPVSHPVEKLL